MAPSVKIHFADGSHVTGCPTDRPSSQHLASYVLHSAWYYQGCRPIIFADEPHLKIEWFRAQSLSAAFKLRLSGAQHIST